MELPESREALQRQAEAAIRRSQFLREQAERHVRLAQSQRRDDAPIAVIKKRLPTPTRPAA
jgi:Flp pilus assembly protein TadD